MRDENEKLKAEVAALKAVAQRTAARDALDVALARQTELQRAGRLLRVGGTAALRSALQRRQFSPPLQQFLGRLLE